MDAAELVIRYHEETKHHLGRYARSPGYMDWANQPNPFRRYQDAPLTYLPLIEKDTSPTFSDIHIGKVAIQPVGTIAVAAFLQCALGLSAWKEYEGARWALRCNPSSGNLHPTEGYVILDGLEDLHDEPSVYHYAPREHALERRTSFDETVWERLRGTLPAGSFFLGFSSIHWREAWKYGERAYRYCQHDVGHALAACAYSAAALGWSVRLCDAIGDAELARLLGLDREEDFEGVVGEHPDLLVAIIPTDRVPVTMPPLDSAAIDAVAGGIWFGKANRLSKERIRWDLIEAVSEACIKPPQTRNHPPAPATTPETDQLPSSSRVTAWTLFRQRRSAVALDGQTALDAGAFFGMLMRTLPVSGHPVWDAMGSPSWAHLLLFVHRVESLSPGLYMLVRDLAQLNRLRESMRGTFLWSPVVEAPPELPLYLLEAGDYRQAAGQVSCGQAIAADGAFSLGMVCDFELPLRTFGAGAGAWYYRRLFWETGMIGQVLYLEAEAVGMRGTGIGCFFDDSVHDLAGFSGHRFQSLYHFTLGSPVEDARLTTLPPYDPSSLRR